MYFSDESVVVECANTYIGKLEMDKSGYFITSKEDKANHGFGLKRIEECAITNGGDFVVEYTEEIFTVRVFFDKERADWKEKA
ncbi:GHKL domain-containing protein [[Clostridium] polysaccharolyticum]|uniref:GHKL domain-containing protein n=1 Tax=[Clostridium] polysaccharolyticum TaxID=29364 RepID=A0A1H9Y4N4_9FIRM|nr:GHKL domain-containing protein [[Clostridium] polysaccharolyticum]SES63837.1 GHKL domain-containing protein [[Clostridium] polysaccharolyticum]